MMGRKLAASIGAVLMVAGLAACTEDGPSRDDPIPVPTVAPTSDPVPAPTTDPGPAPTTDPVSGPAPDANLQQLSVDCSTGDMQACDDLYAASPVGSDEEYWGGTCGGLYPGAPGGTCVSGVSEYFTDPAELNIAQEYCLSGDMDACDFLYRASNFGTDYEAVAHTCGGTRTLDPAATVVEWCSDSTPSSSGDSLYYDSLYDRCADGAMAACDYLFEYSFADTQYFDMADTCGGRLGNGETVERCEYLG